MATLYLKTAGGNWSAAGTWSNVNAGGVDNSGPPVAGDNVVFELLSGNVTIDVASACRSLDTTSGTGTYGGTLTHNAFNLSIGDGTAGTGNVALKLNAGMTYTLANVTSSALIFVATTGTQQTVTTAGKTTGNVTLNGAGGSWQLADSLTATSGSLTLTAGTLDTNGKTIMALAFSSNGAVTRTITWGASAMTFTSSTPWNVRFTGLTVTANTATVTLTQGSASFTTTTAGGDFNGLSIVFTGSGAPSMTTVGGITVANFTRTGTAVKTGSFTLTGTLTVTSTATFTGNSATNRVLIQSATLGTIATIALGAAGVAVATNVDFQDMTFTGTNTPVTGTSLGDCLGNSGITFDSPVTQTHTASAGGNWSDVTKWTSRVPLPQDNVAVDVNTTGTLSQDMARIGKNITFTGFAGTWNIGSGTTLYGNIALGSGMTLSGANNLFLNGRGAQTITSAGRTWTPMTIRSLGGSYTLQDAFISSTSLAVDNGTFNANNFSVSVNTFDSTGGATRAVTLGTGGWSLTSVLAVTVWNCTSAGLTLTTTNSTITIANAASVTRTFAGGGNTYGTLTYTVANSPGSLTITGANTFSTLNVASGRILTMPASTINTISSTFNVNGVSNGYVYFPSNSGSYMSAPDSAALSIVGDIDIRAAVALDDWTPGFGHTIVAKWTTTANQRSYQFYVDTTSKLGYISSVDGIASTVNQVSTIAPTVSDGGLLAIRATHDVDNGAAGNDVKFYTKATTAATAYADVISNSGWTQLGTTITSGGTTSIFDSSSVIEMGTINTGVNNFLGGKYYASAVLSGIDGTLAFGTNLTSKTVGANTFTDTSANAATVTINTAILQVGDGRVSLVSSSAGTAATLSKSASIVSCDYLSIKDSTATGGATWYAGANSTNVSGNTGWIFAAFVTPERWFRQQSIPMLRNKEVVAYA